MRPRTPRFAPALALAALVGWGCGGRTPTPPATPPAPKGEADAIPPDKLDAALAAHLRGVGHMEQYEYAKAADDFRQVRALAPGWTPGAINLAIALLNDSGVKAEDAKKQGGEVSLSNFEQALQLLDGVLARDPKDLHAHYCRGIILEYTGELARAHADFQAVVEGDPGDGHAWYHVGATLPLPASSADEDEHFRRLFEHAQEEIRVYKKALECDPYIVPALYKLGQAYSQSGTFAPKDKAAERPKFQQLFRETQAYFERLDPAKAPTGTGDTSANAYGEMGRYASLIGPGTDAPKAAAGPPPRFGAGKAIEVALPDGHRWAKAADFAGKAAVIGRARARFGAAVATFDADGDGNLDLFLAAGVVGPDGPRDALLLNRGDGKFEDVSKKYGLPDGRASLGVAAGDFDADTRIDLFLTGVGDNRLLRNVGGTFEDVTEKVGIGKSTALSLTARWLDLDQDGDLDLYVLNSTDAAHAADAFTGREVPGAANAAYRNDGKPPKSGGVETQWAPRANAPGEPRPKEGLSLSLVPWPDQPALQGGAARHSGFAALDLDNDGDLDYVLAADGAAPTAVLNDRLGRFHAIELKALELASPVSGLLTTDLDGDAVADLVAIDPAGRVAARRNATKADLKAPDRHVFAFEVWPTDAARWRSALAADLDLDGRQDLLGLSSGVVPDWARNEGKRLAAGRLPIAPDESKSGTLAGLTLADLVGDALPDVVLVRDGEAPRLARNLGNGRHWLALDLGGRWKFGFDRMRTNPHGLGARAWLQGVGLSAIYDHTTPSAGLAQSIGPVVLGLGTLESAQLVRVRWPDGVMQAELNVSGNKRVDLAEYNRKTGSCPVVFAWDGSRFVCLGDYLGGGGLGYLVAPGVYSEPDRDEALLIRGDQLRPVGGVLRLAITEPMDELAYLDRLTLDVVDAPPGVEVGLDERFAPTGPRPTGAAIAWKTTIEPVRANDLAGKDLTDVLRHFDRRTADGFRLLSKWVGYAEEHGIVLDFGDRLATLGPDDRVVLALAGWVEYPYSQTNYAASTAGVALKPPVLERRREDGSWEVVTADVGYPAGLPRRMTLELPREKLKGPNCALRIRTNMDCYYDQAFLAVRDRSASLKTTTLPVATAVLGYRGYMREVSPDGRAPLLYDYDSIDPAPLVGLAGKLTRYGDVAPLLRDDDDHLCLVGPGDEVRLEFDAKGLPPLPDGWTRRYVLRGVGYCKDADPFTAASDTVGPLPWKSMPPYPFDHAGARPLDEGYRAYLDEYQTRPAGER